MDAIIYIKKPDVFVNGTPDADDGMMGSLLLVLREYMTDNAKMSDMGWDI